MKVFENSVPVFRVILILILFVFSNSILGGDEDNGVEDVVKLTVAGQYPNEHLNTKTLKKIGEIVEEKTDRNIVFNIYPANQLGDYTGVFEEVMRGSIDMALISLPSSYDPVYELIYIPYLVNSYEEASDIYSPGSVLFDILSEKSEEYGVKLLGFHADGFTGLSSTKEIHNPLSMSDKKLLVRVPPLKTFKSLAEGMGFSTMSVPYEDLYLSLQTNIVDATFGQSPNTIFHGFRDVVSNYYRINNSFEATGFIVNKKLWDSLSESNRGLIEGVVGEGMSKSFYLAEDEDDKFVRKLESEGVTVVEFSQEDLDKIKEKVVNTVWEDLKNTLGEESISRLEKNKSEY